MPNPDFCGFGKKKKKRVDWEEKTEKVKMFLVFILRSFVAGVDSSFTNENNSKIRSWLALNRNEGGGGFKKQSISFCYRTKFFLKLDKICKHRAKKVRKNSWFFYKTLVWYLCKHEIKRLERHQHHISAQCMYDSRWNLLEGDKRFDRSCKIGNVFRGSILGGGFLQRRRVEIEFCEI